MTGVVLDAKQAANLESQGVLSDRHPAYRCVLGHAAHSWVPCEKSSSRCTCSSRRPSLSISAAFYRASATYIVAPHTRPSSTRSTAAAHCPC